jgi:hypothetical protein
MKHPYHPILPHDPVITFLTLPADLVDDERIEQVRAMRPWLSWAESRVQLYTLAARLGREVVVRSSDVREADTLVEVQVRFDLVRKLGSGLYITAGLDWMIPMGPPLEAMLLDIAWSRIGRMQDYHDVVHDEPPHPIDHLTPPAFGRYDLFEDDSEGYGICLE